MTPAQRKKLREALVARRAAAIAAGPVAIEPTRKDASVVGVADEDEQALTEMNQILASERNRQQADLVKQIDRALRRIDASDEDFGVCEECEEDIPLKRLELMPWATRCAGCQAGKDPARGATRKSLTDFKP
jgi:DnaK suppressor protein